MVLGSRVVDFVNTNLTDHLGGGLVIRDLSNIDDKFDGYHDYNVNATSINPCDLVKIDSKTNSNDQNSSPGILMIVEAEDVELESIYNMGETLRNELKNEGFTVESSSNHSNGRLYQVSIMLNEGYIIARAIPRQKYCGFDIHLWSGFDKQVNAKKALLSAVGGKLSNSSSFRIIAGGMFGTHSWQKDNKLKGPQEQDICRITQLSSVNVESNDIKGVKDSNYENDIIDAAMEVGITKFQGWKKVVALLCGEENDCAVASKKIQHLGTVDKVVLLNCPMMKNFKENTKEASDILGSCEKYLSKVLYDVLKNRLNHRVFNTVIIDQSADKVTGSIFLKVLSSRKKLANALFSRNVMIFAMYMKESEKWRMNIVGDLQQLNTFDSVVV